MKPRVIYSSGGIAIAEIRSGAGSSGDSVYTKAGPAVLLWVRSAVGILELSVADARALADALIQVADYAPPEVRKEAKP